MNSVVQFPADRVPRLPFAQRRALADALFDIPIMADQSMRRAVLSQLSYAAAIPEQPVAAIELHQVVTTALDYPGGIRQLVDVVSGLAGEGARSVIRLRQLAEDLGLLDPETDQT